MDSKFEVKVGDILMKDRLKLHLLGEVQMPPAITQWLRLLQYSFCLLCNIMYVVCKLCKTNVRSNDYISRHC